MTKINGIYVFFGLFVLVIIGLWQTGYLSKNTINGGGKQRKRKLRRKQRLR